MNWQNPNPARNDTLDPEAAAVWHGRKEDQPMTTASGSAAEILRAAKIVESVVGNAWATDADGRFIYVTPDALTFLNLTLDDLNTPPEEGSLGWKRVIHPEDYEDAAVAWRHSLRTGDSYNVEHRMMRANGTYGWGRSTGQPLYDSEGRTLGWYGTVIDGGVSTSADDRPSPQALDVPVHDAASENPPLNLIHPHDRPATEQAMARAFWHGIPQVVSYRRRQADGSYRWAELRAEPGYAVSVDVDPMVSQPTERWTKSTTLGETVEAVRAAKAVEGLFGAAFAFDTSGIFTYTTPIAQTSISLTLEDLNEPLSASSFLDGGDLGWKRSVHPDDYEDAAVALRRCLRTGEQFHHEWRVLRTTGQWVWHRFAVRPTYDTQGRITGWYGVGIDIDVYKKTEAALRERERELSQLIDMVPSHLWRLSPDGEPTFFNKRMADFLGMDVADMDSPGMSRLDRLIATIHPDDAAEFRNALNRSLAGGERFAMRYRLRRADGVYHWMSSRAEPLRNEEGRIVQWYGLCHDIDDQVHAEDALRESERSLRQLIETLPALIYCAAPDGKPIYRSQQLREFLGFNLEDKDQGARSRLVGTLDAIIHPDDLTVVKERYGHSLDTGEPYAMRHRLRRSDGEYRWVETRTAAMRNAEGAIVQWNGVCFDIEDQVQAQEELRLAQERLARASQAASLAELSASIAHEVNQPLAAVVANSHACQRWLNAEPPNLERAQKTVERITRDANSAADVVNRIRALFRQSAEARTDASIVGVIAEAREVLAEEASRRGVRIDVTVASGLPAVQLDRVQIQQVLVNLIRNGLDAMNSSASPRIVSIRARRSDRMIRIEICDRGPGVAFPERIFEPFFTTKGDGMGMGLAICRSIVESHGGRLWAEKNEPQGAKFVFTLPIEPDATP
jgi:PAS domain S-box-containing protein